MYSDELIIGVKVYGFCILIIFRVSDLLLATTLAGKLESYIT